MMNTALIESLKTLSVAKRIQLVEDQWDSIACAPVNVDLPKTQADELEPKTRRARTESWLLIVLGGAQKEDTGRSMSAAVFLTPDA
jgi:putative addiction module component (TIGR02574 family)